MTAPTNLASAIEAWRALSDDARYVASKALDDLKLKCPPEAECIGCEARRVAIALLRAAAEPEAPTEGDVLSACDICQGACMLSELTRGLTVDGVADQDVCGGCIQEVFDETACSCKDAALAGEINDCRMHP